MGSIRPYRHKIDNALRVRPRSSALPSEKLVLAQGKLIENVDVVLGSAAT